METAGFGKLDEALQIAAKSNSGECSVYIQPTNKISLKASEKTGLKSIQGKLYLNDVNYKQFL